MKITLAQFVRVAQSLPDNCDAPFAFEKRIIARIEDIGIPDLWRAWVPAMWKAAAAGLCIFGIATLLQSSVTNPSDDLLDGELEETVLASVNSEGMW